MAKNKQGGFYISGQPLPNYVREEIIELYNSQASISGIAITLNVSKGAVLKIVRQSSNNLRNS